MPRRVDELHTVIAAIAVGMTDDQAATAAGCSPTTIRRRRVDPAVQAELAWPARGETLRRQLDRLSGLVSLAIDRVEAALARDDETSPSVAVSALRAAVAARGLPRACRPEHEARRHRGHPRRSTAAGCAMTAHRRIDKLAQVLACSRCHGSGIEPAAQLDVAADATVRRRSTCSPRSSGRSSDGSRPPRSSRHERHRSRVGRHRAQPPRYAARRERPGAPRR